MKTVYSFDASGAYVGPVTLDSSDESPLEPGVYLIPAGAVETAPPVPSAGEFAKWINGAWVLEALPVAPPPTQPTDDEIIFAKKQAVRTVREGILNRLAGIALAAYLSGDTATTAAYVTVRQGLLEITDNWPTDPAAIDGLVTNRYGALVAQCTPQMISAFAQVDA